MRTVHFAATTAHSQRGRLGRPAALSTAPWLEHTDHDPVEMQLRMGKDWVGEASKESIVSSRPDVLRFMGGSREAASLRVEYAAAVSSELEAISGSSLDWDLVAGVMKKAALQVVGPCSKRSPKPWLQGKEQELHALESEVHVLQEQIRRARRLNHGTLEPLFVARRKASASLRAAKRRWEACWWDDLAVKANRPGEGGNDFAFWQVCRQLGFRESDKKYTGYRHTCANVGQEREAWKTFLQDIQADAGAVDESVWDFIPQATKTHDSLASLPTRQEFDSALLKMKLGKRGGDDDVTVELIRFGGADLKDTVFFIIKNMWQEAARAKEGHEAKSWCDSSKTGVCIPMFKNKGSRHDKANYRNLVMLSVSAKLIARVIATRLTNWAESWLPEEQNGFRPHRGIDDVQQFIRRVLEEVSTAAAPKALGLTCFDIVRAYTRVCRAALWTLLTKFGIPESFLKVLKALHEHTSFKVFIHNGYSSSWFTERGLREGCPSSPVLFSIFHHAVMITFRARRAASASETGLCPGVAWDFKVDGRLVRSGRARHSSRGVRSVTIGDVEFADDTALLGWVDELKGAEALFVKTLLDWEQQEHVGKREKLVIVPGGRSKMDVLHRFEVRLLKHLGAAHCDSADQWAETKRRVQAGFFAVKRVAKYWSLGTHRGRGNKRGLTHSRKLRVMRCVVEGTLLACCKTRVWSLVQERKASQVMARGIRRCLGLDRYNMREHGYSDEALRQLVGWNHFSSILHRSVLNWLGHVARMPCSRLPKMAVFGWLSGLEEHRSCRYTFPMWANWLLSKYGISDMDWFRLAQKPTRHWIAIVDEALPRVRLSARQTLVLNSWQPGDAIPSIAPRDPSSSAKKRPSRDQLKCPACPFVASTAKGLQVHYDSHHAILGDNLTTVSVGHCPFCFQPFVFERDKPRHKCPLKPQTLEDIGHMRSLPSEPSSVQVNGANVSHWRIFTDGAGPVPGTAPFAGWSAAVWENSSTSSAPDVALFGPVCVQKGEQRWLGASTHTNNVGELTAIAEALLWLEIEAPGAADVPATIYYDSTYAYTIITGQTSPVENDELVRQAKEIYARVSAIRTIEFRHVKGHSGNQGNDCADALAAKGARGQQCSQSRRWLHPLNSPPPVDPLLVDHCWRCGKVFSGPSYARQLAGHEAYCKVAGDAPPDIPCRLNCGKNFRGPFLTLRRVVLETAFGKPGTCTKRSVGGPMFLLVPFAKFVFQRVPQTKI